MTDSPGQRKSLNTRQELFVAAYLGDARGNATEAARIAGYKQPHSQGPRLLENVEIAARVKQEVAKHGVTADAVIGELAEVGFSEWRDFIEVLAYDKQGNPVKVRMDLSNKVKALELLGKHLQLFTERQEIDITMREHRRAVPQSTLEQLLMPADRRADA